MLQGYIDELNAGLNRWEQIKKFTILDHDLTVEAGEITPSLKLKRKVVADKYKDLLDALRQLSPRHTKEASPEWVGPPPVPEVWYRVGRNLRLSDAR